ncbi:hypothetical protein [Methanobrevibacter filiformis]|uniref:hypothetical protein n=1 Tax=Methanobrevibacter filiformis TaxID=55758 RepID=UPI0012ED92EA|nr:hypothetical protein [Methanobrevibacter filiformis]
MTKKLKRNFEKFIQHLKHPFLPSTNNVSENYFGITLSNPLKRLHRTDLGLKMRNCFAERRWDEKNAV